MIAFVCNRDCYQCGDESPDCSKEHDKQQNETEYILIPFLIVCNTLQFDCQKNCQKASNCQNDIQHEQPNSFQIAEQIQKQFFHIPFFTLSRDSSNNNFSLPSLSLCYVHILYDIVYIISYLLYVVKSPNNPQNKKAKTTSRLIN